MSLSLPSEIPLYQVDAFTNRPFGGNPAAVCPLGSWLPAPLMQKIAAENNLSETAFVWPDQGGWRLRWFTPRVEVELCGHATLATAHVLWQTARAGDDAQRSRWLPEQQLDEETHENRANHGVGKNGEGGPVA